MPLRCLWQVSLRRERVEIPPTSSALLDLPESSGDAHVGYIRLSLFSHTAPGQVRAALRQIEAEQGVRGLILDLRGNPGGLVNAGIETAALFLPPGSPVLQVVGRDTGRAETIRLDDKLDAGRPVRNAEAAAAWGRPSELPLVVLVDEDSASAAEILAGALRDGGRAQARIDSLGVHL